MLYARLLIKAIAITASVKVSLGSSVMFLVGSSRLLDVVNQSRRGHVFP